MGVGGAALVGGIYASNQSSRAAGRASDAQSAAAFAGIDEQRRQFDLMQGLLEPYVQAGARGLHGQSDIAGINGPEAQQRAIDQLQASPIFQDQLKRGEGSILANASATGGLRGGNVQGALATFSPMLLNQTINDQYARLGGMTTLGQNSAVMTGNAGMRTGSGVSDLLGQAGAAQAGGFLAGGRANAGYANSLFQGFGAFGGMYRGGFGGGGGGGSNAPGYTSPGGYGDAF